MPTCDRAGTVDCPGKGVWGYVGVTAAKGVFDRCGMISGRFQGMGHCTHVRNDFREFKGRNHYTWRKPVMGWFRKGKPET